MAKHRTLFKGKSGEGRGDISMRKCFVGKTLHHIWVNKVFHWGEVDTGLVIVSIHLAFMTRECNVKAFFFIHWSMFLVIHCNMNVKGKSGEGRGDISRRKCCVGKQLFGSRGGAINTCHILALERLLAHHSGPLDVTWKQVLTPFGHYWGRILQCCIPETNFSFNWIELQWCCLRGKSQLQKGIKKYSQK